MKKIIKASLIFILMLSLMVSVFQTTSNAESSYSDMMGDLIKADYSDNTGTDKKVIDMSATILTSIRIVGLAVAVVMLLVVAMKYMTAAPGDKADIKKSAIQYVVGAVVLFGAVGILTIISKFSSVVK